MDKRDFVTFAADFPDDARWDNHGNSLSPGGRSIAEAIKVKLHDMGVSCSNVDQHSYYGWAFDASVGNAKEWLLLSDGEGDWLLQIVEQKSLMSRLMGSNHHVEFGIIQSKLHGVLSSDRRFSNILWYTRSDYESGKKDRASLLP